MRECMHEVHMSHEWKYSQQTYAMHENRLEWGGHLASAHLCRCQGMHAWCRDKLEMCSNMRESLPVPEHWQRQHLSHRHSMWHLQVIACMIICLRKYMAHNPTHVSVCNDACMHFPPILPDAPSRVIPLRRGPLDSQVLHGSSNRLCMTCM